jgi:hypothetical protein
MNKLLASVVATVKALGKQRPPTPTRRVFRPALESLEVRDTSTSLLGKVTGYSVPYSLFFPPKPAPTMQQILGTQQQFQNVVHNPAVVSQVSSQLSQILGSTPKAPVFNPWGFIINALK